MNITLLNQTASIKTYNSGTVSLPASGSVAVSSVPAQMLLAEDANLFSDIRLFQVYVSDTLNIYIGDDAINYLKKIWDRYNPLTDMSGNEIGTRANPIQTNLPGVISTVNSTSSNLGSNATFTGTAEEVTDCSVISVQIFTDQASATSGFKPQYSADGTNWDDGDAYTIAAQVSGNGKYFTFPPQARY